MSELKGTDFGESLYSAISDNFDNLISAWKNYIEDTQNLAPNPKAPKEISDNATNTGVYYQFPLNIEDHLMHTQIVFNNRHRNHNLKAATNATSIFLPMPSTINFPTAAGWKADELGVIGGIAKDVIKEFRSDGAKGGMNELVDKLQSIDMDTVKLMAATELSKILNFATLDFDGAGGIQGVLQKELKAIKNPYMEQFFEGITFREFSFSWSFLPESQIETNRVEGIIKQLRKATLPSYKKENSNAFFEYPGTFNIYFNFKNGQNLYLPSLTECACTNVNVNYTPDGEWRAFEETGAPTRIEMELSFIEMDIITAESVEDGK